MNWTNIISTWLDSVYQLFCTVKIPGLNIPFISLFYGAFGALLSIMFLKGIWGVGDSTVSKVVGHTSRGGNNKNIKTSEKRKGDTK